MFEVGDKVKILVNKPDCALLNAGDVVRVRRVYDPRSMVVSGGWRISSTEGEHAELTDKSAPDHEDEEICYNEYEAAPDPAYDDDVAIDKVKAESLCRLYAQYREHHCHDDAFRIAWEIEAKGLPF